MATIRKRGNLQWEARIRKRGYPTTCKTFDTKAEAGKWAKETEATMGKGQYVSAKEAEAYTLAESRDRFTEEYLPRLKDPRREIYRIDRLKRRAIAHRIMATIRSKDIADFRREREAEGVSPNTIRLDLALLSRLFNYARSDWGMESLTNPVALASKPKLPTGRTRRLEPGEEERLLAVCAPEFALVVRFALATAMMRGEIVGGGGTAAVRGQPSLTGVRFSGGNSTKPQAVAMACGCRLWTARPTSSIRWTHPRLCARMPNVCMAKAASCA